MPHDSNLLGIDIGSVSVSAVEINASRDLVRSAYTFHRGDPRRCLKEMLHSFDLTSIAGVAATTSTPSFVIAEKHYDDLVCLMAACRHLHGPVGSILLVGGEKFGLIRFDEAGDYRSYRGNTSCAAGTGSFLDQQARRLGLGGVEALSSLASENRQMRPKIASRCAVFAKTDLVHAQQEGYTRAEICDGLCYGLAKNVVDTVICGEDLRAPVLFVGGVSLNRAVAHHLEDLIDQELVVGDSAIHNALGAALLLEQELEDGRRQPVGSIENIFAARNTSREYAHPPLRLERSDYPEFKSLERHLFMGRGGQDIPVEVDCYETIPKDSTLDTYLGIDIGSTSTKAVLLGPGHSVIAGFYTRTGGRPLDATQHVFASIEEMVRRRNTQLNLLAVGTTGSGRKFVGKLIGADLALNEISAHARAAVELNPDVDTIIEIGGQDSKFTVLRNGIVTFSVLNTVCAAGTGSFIEEQAEKLGCPLEEVAAQTENRSAPLSSNRCTVFMERDINHYLNDGYAIDDILASVLHSVRENYLNKVAVESQIGETILFQGATAKNRSLVAAFEQRLMKPIHVSKFCHLTGALGVALVLADRRLSESCFRGLDLCEKPIPVRSEVCSICTNHCKITVAELEGENIAYGFLCGRDYETRKYVDNNQAGFDLLKARKHVSAYRPEGIRHPGITIAIPAALHLHDDLAFWRFFFSELGIRTRTSEDCREPVSAGKNLTGAEFCAPITALHGHLKHLLEDGRTGHGEEYLFLPFYLEKKPRANGKRRQYCYYTQFAPALAAALADNAGLSADKILTPLVHYLYHSFHTKAELYRMLSRITDRKIGYFEVASAFEKALEFKADVRHKLKELYIRETESDDRLHVVLLGRPYSVLARSMNKKIPHIFSSLGIKVFFQDMLTIEDEDLLPLGDLLDEFPWYFARQILQAASVVARSRSAYPVLITSFKCSPDSFVVEQFRELMEAHQKPYLVLQLDEHDSSVGYETRIEAAIESFRNHFEPAVETVGKRVQRHLPLDATQKIDLDGKTLLLPSWDELTLRLVAAVLRREGIDARLLEGKPTTIRRSLRANTGQCTPLSLIAQEFIDYVQEHSLDPAETVLWVVRSNIACNICMFPHHIRKVLQSYGGKMAEASVYAGNFSFMDLSLRLPIDIYFAYMFGGFLRKMACRVRPYECQRGSTDRAVREAIQILEEAELEGRGREEAIKQVVTLFKVIKTRFARRPKVAIFGDLYVRDNDFINQGLVHFIEENGGEVVTTPFSALIKMVSTPYLRKWIIEGDLLAAVSSKAFLAMTSRLERTYLRLFREVLGDPEPPFTDSAEGVLSEYSVRLEHTGESMENLLKLHYIKKHHPDISLFVQASPAFCCPSLVTEAMAHRIEQSTGVPVVSITYDGTGGNKNEAIIPYLKCRRPGDPGKLHQIL